MPEKYTSDAVAHVPRDQENNRNFGSPNGENKLVIRVQKRRERERRGVNLAEEQINAELLVAATGSCDSNLLLLSVQSQFPTSSWLYSIVIRAVALGMLLG